MVPARQSESSHPAHRPGNRGADRLVRALADAGVRAIFALPGGPIAPVHDALLDVSDIRLINVHHENHALFAAAGYARASGRVGVAAVTAGPGVLNAMTGIASAYCDDLPVLTLVGDVARPLHGKRALQDGHELNMKTILASVTKWTAEVPDANALVPMLAHGWRVATSGRPGPVALIVPMDVLLAEARIGTVALSESVDDRIAGAVVEQVRACLMRSCSRVIVAGAGVRLSDGPQQLRTLAEQLGCPVITTPSGKGAFPESHRQSLGVFGMGGHPSASDFLALGVDTLLVVGARLDDVTTNGWSQLLRARQTLIHIDVDTARMGCNYAPDLAIGAPIAPFLRALCLKLGPQSLERVSRRYGVRRCARPTELTNGPDGRIDPRRAIWEIQSLVPESTIFAIDSGEHFAFATHYLHIDRADGFSTMVGLGSMASSISALGFQLAQPGRPVAVICGDGGFTMLASELATLARHRLPVWIFVFNDGRAGMVERGNRRIYGRTPDYSNGPTDGPLDVAGMARSLGARALVVERAGDILALDMAGASGPTPVVIDVRIDRGIAMATNRRFDALEAVAEDATRPVKEFRDIGDIEP